MRYVNTSGEPIQKPAGVKLAYYSYKPWGKADTVYGVPMQIGEKLLPTGRLWHKNGTSVIREVTSFLGGREVVVVLDPDTAREILLSPSPVQKPRRPSSNA